MAFDKATRNRLNKCVADARGVLSDEFTRQMQATYGLDPNTGSIADVSSLTHLDNRQRETAQLLRETLAHYVASLSSGTENARTKQALERMVREQAFTVLNRLAALRMAEARGFLLESVAKGYTSKGFQLYKQLTGGALGETGDAYRSYLFSLFDEFTIDLTVLFDRHSTQSLLFPREPALLALLDLLNAPDIEVLWPEDEAIGWIYQYYNDPDERKKMRKESSAPRNSRELAVRNQFFTPRYVVEFLTDNTLGRIWYEMTKGETRLTEQCRYLVRRPTEFFLGEGEEAPELPESDTKENLSQEELLKQPVHIPHRPVKDPREIRLLDPACGSMHFGLYAFDLFEAIYEEAWDKGLCPALQELYPKKADYLREVPRLIIEHNIHGVDIDPRAVQIAGLSLWLRAQKSWKGIPAAGRPRIRRSNIICAEPMPGNAAMLEDFAQTLHPPLLGELVKSVFEKMQLAGEAGTLLKIEEEIRTAIADARQAWDKLGSKSPELFTKDELNRVSTQPELSNLDTALRAPGSQLTGDFFDSAEERIYAALHDYAISAEAGDYQRRLFAEDAAHGFAFIDLCRKRYDAVVMNPPFGEFTGTIDSYIGKHYKKTKTNIYCTFVDRAFDLCPKGMVGLISARTFVMYRDFEDFRLDLLLDASRITAFADLGWEVLDGAQVETAAYVLARSGQSKLTDDTTIGPFIRVVDVPVDEKETALLREIAMPGVSASSYSLPKGQLTALPGAALAYWASGKLVQLFSRSPTFEPELAYCGRGAAVHVFYFRLSWEIPLSEHTPDCWVRLAHGGEYSPFFRENSVFIDWEDDGRRPKEYILQKYPYLKGNVAWAIQDEDKYGQVGLTSGKRNERFNVQLMPRGHIFTNEGQGFIPNNEEELWFCLAYLNSSLVSYFLTLTSGLQKTWVYIRPVPVVPVDDAARLAVAESARMCHRLKCDWFTGSEESALFLVPWTLTEGPPADFVCAVRKTIDHYERDSAILNESRDQISQRIMESAGIGEADQEVIRDDYSRHPKDVAFSHWRGFEHSAIEADFVTRVVSYLFGTPLGRWDIRYAIGELQSPDLPNPVDPLPICPPGMLQNADGLPAAASDVPTNYPLRITWPGILVDDDGHPEDIVARVRDALVVIWGDRSAAIEQEACEILGVGTLRDYFAEKKSGGKFFKDHLKRYSKSRRQAPIYLPLSTKSGSYTLWIYYHRLTEQTLYSCVNDFVEPKLQAVTNDLAAMRSQLTRTAKEEKEFARLVDLEGELKDLLEELLRIAKFWKPNLNDGVQITAAPLWSLFRLKKWQRTLQDTWKKLEQGDYDWAHLACSVWPERVLRKCHEDRSLAIAHGVEEDFWAEAEIPVMRGKKATGKTKLEWRPKSLPNEAIKSLISKIEGN